MNYIYIVSTVIAVSISILAFAPETASEVEAQDIEPAPTMTITTRIYTPELPEDKQIINYIKKVFPENWKFMVAIAKAESQLKPNVNYVTTAEDSRGIFQINEKAHKTNLNLYDWKVNIDHARKVYDSQGLKAWGAYTNGNYKRFMIE